MLEIFFQFLKTGFAHIIPHGPDHVLFVLGLFLICREFPALLLQITLFTFAHSMTMGLAMGGVLELPSKPVEVLIALSIAFIAAENLSQRDLTKWRQLVVILSGWVHGLGFAHAFREHTIPSQHPVAALFGMSLGVEMGQIFIVTAAFLLFGPFWQQTWYRRVIVLPGSIVLLLTGLWWAVERLPA